MRTLSFLLVITSLLAGCLKTCPNNVLPEMIKPFLFKPGSYWVFSNSVTGNLDTFTVIKGELEILKGNKPIRCKEDRGSQLFEMIVVSSTDTFRIPISGNYISFSSASRNLNGNIFDVSMVPGQCSKSNSSLCSVDVSSLTIGGNTFNETHKVITTIVNSYGETLYSCDLYWVKNIGIVRAVRHDSRSTTLNIIESHVVQ
jgi:hypothetical protein